MAYDFGSQTLGISNPFKTEGKLRTVTGALLVAGGLYPLLKVAATLPQNAVLAYTYAVLGFILVAAGFTHLGKGIFQLFRYFVGRSVPVSLAYNRSRSEQEAAQAEQKALLYTDDSLHAMLMGRKNTTFKEPKGWVARLLHSVFPNLTFLPYPLRNMAQELGSLAISLITALISFAIVWFVVSTGLAGEKARLVALPLLSVVLLVYLIRLWAAAGAAMQTHTKTQLDKASGISVTAVVVMSILVPVFAGFVLDSLIPVSVDELSTMMASYQVFSAGANFGLLLLALIIVVAGIMPCLIQRMKNITPQTEVSEYRENLQESVHPNEIFINLENIVLANRRYKEIPNRLYRELDPVLKEQADGKGSFNGELLIETQPVLADNDHSPTKAKKLLPSGLAQICVLLGFVLFYQLGIAIAEGISMLSQSTSGFDSGRIDQTRAQTLIAQASDILFYLFAWLTFSAAGRMLNNASHLFWGELNFESLLMYLKAEGTFNESRFSTGMSIHDSTRSENVLVRSSITPWIITSKIHSSIFATSGVSNLETPRFIMGMNKNDSELKAIVGEIKDFLKARESIASITNEADLQSAGVIHQVNSQTRAHDSNATQDKITLKAQEEAAGYLRNNPDTSSS